MTNWRLGIDIGGTFTDIVLLGDDGELRSKKILSTPNDYSQAIEEGVRALLDESAIKSAEISEIAHGTTVATNTIIERKGAQVALITTRGFRDVLEIARFRAPQLYDIDFRKPEPLVERRLRFEVQERIRADGEVDVSLDEAELKMLSQVLSQSAVDAIAICFVNAYVNDQHEARAKSLLAQWCPNVPVTVSSELLPQIQEYERTSTTVINAYLRPVVEQYVEFLEQRLKRIGIAVPLNIMQSNGGLLRAKQAASKPMFIIESGPAAGVVGAERMLQRLGTQDLIVFDMGGTTAKASVIAAGEYNLAPEAEVGGGAALGHRMVRGAGHVVQAPTIDIAEVGAGGGSIAWVDAGGGFQVGPQSAGAAPGPACYGRGGHEPTVTDANLSLGYINPSQLVGGDLALDTSAARKVIKSLGEKLNQSEIDTAYGVHLIANARMMRALSAVSSERGLDPAKFSLLAFGGNGGVHVCGLAEAIGTRHVVVPPAAGLFSALGLLFAPPLHQCIKGFYQRLDTLELNELNHQLAALASEARELLSSDGFSRAQHKLDFSVEMKYAGQNAALSVALPGATIDAQTLDEIAEGFATAHDATFGYRSDGESLQLVALKVSAQGVAEQTRVPDRIQRSHTEEHAQATRKAYFGPDIGWRDCEILSREQLPSSASESPRQGPLIVEEYDCTTVVRPGWNAQLDPSNNIVLRRSEA